jgi:hypothetical protein
MRSPPSTKVSTKATGGITKAATVKIKNWFERGQSPLSSSVQEINLLYSLASNMMAIKANAKKRQCQECHEGGSPGATVSGGRVHKVLEAARHLTL